MLKVVGRTQDGRPVLGGFHKLLESQGIPLQFFLEFCRESRAVPDWRGYVEDALSLGWNLSTVLSRAEEATTDVFGRDHAREVMTRLRLYVVWRAGANNPVDTVPDQG